MENYIIKKVNQDNIEYLIFGTSVESPLFYINELSNKIKTKKEVNILFDQLLQTGNSDNRFIMINFKNGTFELNTSHQINSNLINNNIKSQISNFLRLNPLILNYSILLSEQKEIIKQGGII